MLGLYGLTGWYIGMQNSRIPMLIAITQNVVNIAASLCLVYLCGMKVEGVALGTLIAQYAGLLMGIVLWMRHYGYLWASFRREGLFRRSVMKRFFEVNRDIFLRTLCLVAVTLFFTSAGAGQGEIILAVNTLLMQLFTLYSYIMDGFAYAGEALSGKYIGAGDRASFSTTVRRLFGWGAVMALLFTATYALGGQGFLNLLTDDPSVTEAAAHFSAGHSSSPQPAWLPLSGTASTSVPPTHAACCRPWEWRLPCSSYFIMASIHSGTTMPCGWPFWSICRPAAWCKPA